MEATSPKEPYATFSPDELAGLPTVFRDGLFLDRVVVVTGGGGVIGTALCVLFGRLGATVVACGRSEERLEELSGHLTRLAIRHSTHPLTVRDPERVAAFVDEVWERHGRLDVLINNAGGQFALAATEITPKGWSAVVETILYGTWYASQAAARRWIGERAPGSIINVTTTPGFVASGIPHTVAARAGQAQLTRALALEWAPHSIRVNGVAVGVVSGPSLHYYPRSARPFFEANPQRRVGDVHDVAEACAYLAAPSAKFLTGVILPVDGGGSVWGEFWPLGKPDYFRIED
jgi:NAD(P)-dependent dehydrogenase (short-subunit alcohol dehydrogenase family)